MKEIYLNDILINELSNLNLPFDLNIILFLILYVSNFRFYSNKKLNKIEEIFFNIYSKIYGVKMLYYVIQSKITILSELELIII